MPRLKADIAHRASVTATHCGSNPTRQLRRDLQSVLAKPEGERTPGETLLATQVLKAASVSSAAVDRVLTAEDSDRKKALAAQIAALTAERPKPIPMAEIATDGDYRSSPLGEGDDTISCPKCRIPVPGAGPYLHQGPGRYQVPPSYFLIRGDVENHGSQMTPGFIDVITYGNPPTEIPRPDGRTSGRRLALARWIASPQNPMTARVIVNRLWQKHFGRGIVATLENFGKMGEPPTHPELLDWMAVDLEKDWSLKRISKLMMMSEAYQMASAFSDAGDRRPIPTITCGGSGRNGWKPRQQAGRRRQRNRVGGEPIFPHPGILVGQFMEMGEHSGGPGGAGASLIGARCRIDVHTRSSGCERRPAREKPRRRHSRCSTIPCVQASSSRAVGSDPSARGFRASHRAGAAVGRNRIGWLVRTSRSSRSHVLLNLDGFFT